MPVITQEPDETKPRHEVIYSGPNDRRSGVDRRQSAGRDAGRDADPEARDREEVIGAATMAGGSSLELIGGGGAVVLAIIGLAGYLPLYMTSIATIAIGGALLAHGATATARVSDAMRRAVARRAARLEVAGGVGSEVFGGACGIALGILALAGVLPFVLLSVAAIVLGGAILLGAPAEPELARLAPDDASRAGRLTYEAVEGASGAMVLTGVGAIVLGILGLIGVGPALTLVLVAMLGVGGAAFLGGSALTARFARRLQRVA